MIIMFTFLTGDILQSTAVCLVNTVNCEGYMGKGIAYQFKKRFPLNNKDYVSACRTKKLQIGAIHTFEEDGKYIVNFPTKNLWREKSRIDYIHIGMPLLIDFLIKNNIKSCAIPPLGCGNGGLKWSEVKPIIINYITPIKDIIDFQIYEPGVFSRANSVKEPNKPTLSHIILMSIKLRLKQKTKLNLQKSAYFFNLMTHEDFFKFTKYKYGPYSHAIDIVSKQIKESQDYYKLNTEQYIKLCMNQLISKSVEERLKKYSPYINLSTDLINSYDNSSTVELIATICYLLQSKPLSIDKIVESVHDWSERKRTIFTIQDITQAIDSLSQKNIISSNLAGEYEIAV